MREDDVVWKRWSDVDRVFERALDAPEADREPLVRRLCDGDAELREAVLDLLARSRTGDARVLSPGPELLGRALAPGGRERPGSLAPGDIVGRYRVVGELGRGGMATVYEAERSDGAYRQTVALKVLRRGLDTDRIIDRFLAERQILSDFAHPNVARLLDGGAAPDGRPFLVMEKVDGEPLTIWADGREAGIRARLELFLQVTDAVKEAHRRLVVHRDLKPGNILVTEAGDVKLLDFGIAKLIDPAGGETDLTVPGAYPLTLRYASPEQLRGEMVTASSDIYQLGLILFEILTGLHPFAGYAVPRTAADPGSPTHLVRAIASEPLDRLEDLARRRASTPRALERRLRGDLETIVARTLESDPEDRYRSVEDLAEDIRRHVEGKPIRARPAPWTLRSRKWLARNRWAPPVAAVLALAAAGWVGTLTVNAQRLERERNEARAHAERAEQVTAYLTGVFEAVDPDELGGVDVTVIELLDESAARAAIELEGQPEAQAEVLSTIGAMYVARGQYDRAKPLLERSVELRRGAGGDPADLVRDLRRLADALYDDRDRAISVLAEAVALAERNLGPGDARLGAALTDLARRLSTVRTPEAHERARASLDRALAILRDQPDTDVRAELAEALNLSALGGDLSDLPRLEEALELRRSVYGGDHTEVAGTLNDMALLLEPFDPQAADTLLEQAAAINERIHGPDHRLTLSILNNLAGRYRDRGDFAKAEPLYRTVLERRRAAYPSDSVAHAYAMHGLGWSLTETGRPAEAEPLLREVVRLVDPGPGRVTSVHQMSRSTLGRCLEAQGRYAEAEVLLLGSYETTVATSPNTQFIPLMLDRLIALYDAWNRPEAAEEFRAIRRGP
jgi:serine/threonine-protein kinase